MSPPPKLAQALLKRCLRPGLAAESLLGDLEADFNHLMGRVGPRRAQMWYWAQAARIGLRVVWEWVVHARLLRPRGGPTVSGGGKMSGRSALESLWQDIRYAGRTLRREPLWTVATLGTLVLGIGATVAIFTVVNAVLIKPLDLPQAHRLVMLEYRPADRATAEEWAGYNEYMARHMRRSVSFPTFETWRSSTEDLFSDLGAFDDSWTYDLSFGAETGTERLPGTIVNAGLLRALGVPASRGRLFTDADDAAGAPLTLILSHGLWVRRFGADPDVVGRALSVNGDPHTVVGIMPAAFAFPDAGAEFWMPMAGATRGLGSTNYQLVGRLGQGLDARVAHVALTARAVNVFGQNEVERRYSADFITLRSSLVGDVRPSLILFLAAVVALLLIASVNVLNLMLTRATRRQHEHVIRTAVGAGPGRITQQLVTESLMVSLVGGGLGLVLAHGLVRGVVAIAPASLPRQEAIATDGNVVVFSLALAVGVGLAVGFVPALQASRSRALSLRPDGLRSALGTLDQGRLRDTLVVLQLALAMVLLVGGGLLSRSFASILGEEHGFDSQGVLTIETSLPSERYPTFQESRLFYEGILEQARTLPAVTAAAAAAYPPASGWFHWTEFEVDGYEPQPGEESQAEILQVTPGYFTTLGMAIVEGRDFTSLDDGSGLRGVAVSEGLARTYFPAGNAVGGRIKRGDVWATVVAVIGDVRYRGAERNAPVIYEPFAASGRRGSMALMIRVDGDPAVQGPAVARIIIEADPSVAVFGVMSLESRLWNAVSAPRFRTMLLAAFGVVSLLLSVLGVYGVMAYVVGRRTREMGIRRVLGAPPHRILREAARRGLFVTVLGIGVGGLAAYGSAGLLAGYLYELEPRDLTTLLSAAGILGLASLIAAMVPAARAARVDPTIALRFE